MDTKPLKPLQRDGLRYADECWFHSAAREAKNTYGIVPEHLEHTIYRDMRQQLAEFIRHHRVEVFESEFHKEYLLDVLVFTKEEFYEVLRNELERMLQLEKTFYQPEMKG